MVRILRYAVMLVALWQCVASAQISVPDEVDQYEPIVATISPGNVPKGAKVRGSITVTKAKYLKAPGEAVYHIWAAPGKHTIIATGVWVLTKDVKVGDETIPVLVDFGQYNESATFTVKGQEPEPKPDPKPDPPIPPDHRWVLIAEETGDRTPEVDRQIAALKKALVSETILILDKDQQAGSLSDIMSNIKQFPTFAIVGSDGKIAYQQSPLPTVERAKLILSGELIQ